MDTSKKQEGTHQCMEHAHVCGKRYSVVIRYRQYNSAYLLARGHKELYDSVWKGVLCTEAAALETLRLTEHNININTCKERPMQQVEVSVTEETNHTIFMRGCDIFTFDVEKPRAKPRETSKKQDFQSCSTGRLKEVRSSQNSMLMTTSHKVSKDFHVMSANNVSQDDMMVLADIGFSNKKPDSGGAHLNFMAVSVRFLHSFLLSSRSIGAGQLVRVQSPEFVSWVDLYHQPAMVANIKWAKLKNLPRTVNKLLGAYGGDVSRLLDVCHSKDKIVVLHTAP